MLFIGISFLSLGLEKKFEFGEELEGLETETDGADVKDLSDSFFSFSSTLFSFFNLLKFSLEVLRPFSTSLILSSSSPIILSLSIELLLEVLSSLLIF